MRDLEAWWSSDAFADELGEWVSSRLAARGHVVTGPVRAHRVRFWSAVFGVPTEAGTFWVKVANPGQGFEVDLTSMLADLVPEHVLAPTATRVDRVGDRFWLLLPDGGTTLRDHGGATVAHWRRLVRDAADMQRALVPHHDRLVGAGLVPMTADDAEPYAERVVGWARALPDDDPQQLDDKTADGLLARLPVLAEDMALLAGSGIPDTLQHNDLSDSNAFVSGPAGLGPLRFFDLGDAFWSHPFAALHLTLCFATERYPWPDLASETGSAVVDSYLECWPEHGDVEGLRRLVVPAMRLALLHRAESWRRLLAAVPPRPDPPRLVDLLEAAVSDVGGTMRR